MYHSTKEIREESIKLLIQLGINLSFDSLPLLDEESLTKSYNQVVDRILCLNVVAACAHGFDRKQGVKWLKSENLLDELTTEETRFLDGIEGDHMYFCNQIEAMWALAWSLNVIDSIDFTKSCSDDFVYKLPDLMNNEDSNDFRSKYKLRDLSSIQLTLDFVYCLHWYIRQCQLDNMEIQLPIDSSVITERRRAFEWLFDEGDWEDVDMST